MLREALRTELHVWVSHPEPLPLALLLERYDSLLNDEERERCHRFHFEHDRQHFVAAHALSRLAIAHYLQCAPQELAFARHANGKPYLAAGSGQPPLRFNLSHTRGMVACVMTQEHDCGIDVERVREMTHLDGVAETVFSERELDYLKRQSIDASSRLNAFFRLWTLKEAYIKATGLGMSAPLRQISIIPAEMLLEDPGLSAHQKMNWLFDAWQPSPGHAIATACNAGTAIGSIHYFEFNLADGSLAPFRTRQLTTSLA
ncbi:4'-phosphopantetheinyl transferase [Paucimonas lemoignei]|uniref:4'-phosphopantetheinyl transferase n=1 Tax=Paucimonas lemoignei TaxID=29443 RepID=A0A4R3I3N6_PAULE|nr:4'-phosphopantetheinyl transferase superfamily protein [Paucimonas lemoignei]TCS39451.1 4'-phosphopantetheinyl transferase [Paucimonas lemoignei]